MNARDRIFQRLAAAQTKGLYPAPAPEAWYAARARNEAAHERTARFASMMEAARAEVHRVHHGDWVQKLFEILSGKGIGNLLVAPATRHGAAAREGLGNTGVDCLSYDRPIEEWKEELFNDVQASLTAARGAIAETGTLILWPDAHEPRLMSLVPPVHIVLVDASAIHATFFDAMQSEGWADGMPTNALLISSPSKTADIQQTLAYGAHGPKELIVLLREEA
ncbi:MAG TPA: lactate utilization protein [Rhodocyclaceae bacterium]|nr:lactate utilization protein [Rhodocyclaceae bacterium]